MKGSLIAAAAALVAGASAKSIHHRHADAHKLFERGTADDLCTTIIQTVTGECIWTPTPAVFSPATTPAPAPTTTKVPVAPAPPAPVYNTTVPVYNTTTSATLFSTTTVVSTTTPPPAPVDTTVVVPSVVVPTPVVSTCKVPGTYTFPATTIVVTETTTVCGASTTSVPAGTHTLGGVTTVVATETTVVCPYATSKTLSGGVVTSVIETTSYVCPSAGTYTIAPITTVCSTATVVVVPVVTSYVPATYTRPAVVTTVTETDVVVVCPFGSPVTSTVVPAPSSSSWAVDVPITRSTEAPVPTTTEVATTSAPAPAVSSSSSTKVVVASSSTSSASFPLGTSPTILGGGDQWAITYTPYTTTGQCKGASDVLADVIEIKAKGFHTVRVYSTDCDTLENVGAACEKTGVKMIIGVFISEVGCGSSNPDVESQISTIKAWAKWDLVELVVVGNEAGNQGFCTPTELSKLIVEVQTIIKDCGASVPVTTTDTVNVWQNEEFSSALCPIVDVVACNAHAYFNAGTTPSGAGAFVSGQLDIVKKICGKEGYVLETGWPSSCVANGIATCSPTDQATAIASLRAALGGSVVFFSYSNDDWKDNGACECEKHWGIGQLFN